MLYHALQFLSGAFYFFTLLTLNFVGGVQTPSASTTSRSGTSSEGGRADEAETEQEAVDCPTSGDDRESSDTSRHDEHRLQHEQVVESQRSRETCSAA